MNMSTTIDRFSFKMKGKSIIETPTSEDMSEVKMNENAKRHTVHNTMNKSKMENKKSAVTYTNKDHKLSGPLL